MKAMRIILLAALFAVAMLGAALAGELWEDLPEEQRVRFRNPDGSCVQCSIGMLGVHADVAAAEFLLWQSKYGPAVRGGSYPERVRHYCEARNIPAWIVTGHENAKAWTDWALDNGRWAAIHWGPKHMINAVGRRQDADGQWQYAVCDNNSPTRIDWYSESQFVRNLGQWAVVLDTPPPPGTPAIVAWWQ